LWLQEIKKGSKGVRVALDPVRTQFRNTPANGGRVSALQ
jgi:hypothetical protein